MSMSDHGDDATGDGAIRHRVRSAIRVTFRNMHYRTLSDRELVRRAGLRNEAAFNTLSSRYAKRVHAVTLASLMRDNHPESALRDTVIEAFQEMDSFAMRCTQGTQLYRLGLRAAFGRLSAADVPLEDARD